MTKITRDESTTISYWTVRFGFELYHTEADVAELMWRMINCDLSK